MTGAEIVAIVDAVLILSQKLPVVIKALKSGATELTPEQEAELDAKIAALKDQPHWKLGE